MNFNTTFWSSLVPRPTPFFILWFVLTIIHRGGRAAKNRKGLGEFIRWMMSGGHEADVGGKGLVNSACPQYIPHHPVSWVWAFHCSDFRRCSQLPSPVFKFTCSWAPPLLYTSTRYHSRDEFSLFFAAVPLPSIIVNASRRTKTG